MKIVKNEKKIKIYARIGSGITIVALAVLGVGMYLSFTNQDQFYISVLALLVGFILSQVGIYFTNRWGRRPRPDELLDQALKGLDKRFSIYHYHTPVAHVLVGPAGIWILNPKHQRGTITYEKNRWRQKGGGFFQAYLRFFAQEGIGRPDLEIDSDLERLQKYLKKKLPDIELPPIQSVLVFFHPEVVLQVDDAPIPTLFGKKLKDFIRKVTKEKSLSPEIAEKIQGVLES